MSIFPKRTLQNTSVTIHWNYNTAHLHEEAICPFVRIGVINPLGETAWLFEKHLPALPSIQQEEKKKEKQFLYLNKNTPLLVLADYISGPHKKEKLVQILENLQTGKHFYFTYNIPGNAPLGKYLVVSEVHNGGHIRYSTTAADDFFFVEKIEISRSHSNQLHQAVIVNLSPEPVPVKIIHYTPEQLITPLHIEVYEIPGNAATAALTVLPHSYLSYSEERELIPLAHAGVPRCIRNHQYLLLTKKEPQQTYLIHNQTEEAFALTPLQQEIWQLSNGINNREEVRNSTRQNDYDEMLNHGLIQELSVI